jgi:hypothetical protein
VCFGLGGRRKHALQDDPTMQARILTLEGSSNTLCVDNTFGEVRPSLGWRHSPRISALKDNVITKPGPSPPGSSPRIWLGQAAAPRTTRPVALTPRRDRRRLWQEKRATLRLRHNDRVEKGTLRRSISYPFPFFLFLSLATGTGKGGYPEKDPSPWRNQAPSLPTNQRFEGWPPGRVR